MRISIIGAGLSGLSCAFYLEKYGLTPIIYEKESHVGNFYVTAEAMFSILSKPIIDPYNYLGQKYKLFLNPSQTVNELMFFSPNKQIKLEGYQGFVNLRGDVNEALEKQILKKIKTPIKYNHKYSYKEISTDSDYVVIATGDPEYIRNITKWRTDLNIQLISVTIKGDFNAEQVKFWLNNRFAPKGYAYFLPWNNKIASVAVGIPKQEVDLNNLFSLFLDNLDMSFNIINKFDIHNFIIGQPERNQLGNTLIIGNAGGFLMPFLGFGQFSSIISGLMAGKAIIEGKDFNKLINPLRKEYTKSLNMRKKLESLQNEHYDMLVDVMNYEIIRKIYFSPHINSLKWLGELIN